MFSSVHKYLLSLTIHATQRCYLRRTDQSKPGSCRTAKVMFTEKSVYKDEANRWVIVPAGEFFETAKEDVFEIRWYSSRFWPVCRFTGVNLCILVLRQAERERCVGPYHFLGARYRINSTTLFLKVSSNWTLQWTIDCKLIQIVFGLGNWTIFTISSPIWVAIRDFVP